MMGRDGLMVALVLLAGESAILSISVRVFVIVVLPWSWGRY